MAVTTHHTTCDMTWNVGDRGRPALNRKARFTVLELLPNRESTNAQGLHLRVLFDDGKEVLVPAIGVSKMQPGY